MELPNTEARLFRAYWQDGLLDLLAGLAVSLIGAAWLFDFVLAVVIVPPVVITMWPLLRARITEPRLGSVRFNSERMSALRVGLGMSVAVGVGFLALVLIRVLGGSTPSTLSTWIAPGIPALLLAVLAVLASQLLQLRRIALYAVILVASALLVALLAVGPGWALLLAGAIVAISGVLQLARFMNEFPRLPEQTLG